MFSRFGSIASKALLSVSVGLGGVAVAGGVMGLKTAASMEQAKIAFTTMLGSATKADIFLKQLANFAAKTPFEFPELQTAASSLISAGINANKVIPIMTTLGNVTSGMGTGAEGVKRATIALQQMSAAGKITGEDLNQLRDAGIPVYDLLAKATGKSKAEVVKLAQAGKLGSKELGQMMKALETGKGMERFAGLMDKQSKSLSGVWSTFMDTLNMGLAKSMQPILPMLKDGLAKASVVLSKALAVGSAALAKFLAQMKSGEGAGGKVAHIISTVAKSVSAFVTGMREGTGWGGKFATVLRIAAAAALAVATATIKAVQFLTQHKAIAVTLVAVIGTLTALTYAHAAAMAVSAAGGMMSWLKQTKIISAATKVWAAVQWLLNAAMSANPIVLVVIAIAALVAAFIIAWKHSDKFREVVTKAWEKVKAVTIGVVSAVINFVKSHWPLILAILTGPIGIATLLIIRNFGKIKSAASSVVGWVKSIPSKLAALGAKFGAAGRGLMQGFIDGMKNAAGIIKGIAGNVWNAVKGLLNGAISKINAALDFKISLPGPDLHVNTPNIPMLATGGRATGATLAVFGEGREAENVLPDSLLRGLLEKVHESGRQSGMAASEGRTAPLIGQVNQLPGEDANTLAERLWFKTRTRG
jgi:tape measure domain-containing protein